MAGNIKGITIEFNGDTTKLDKALRQINNETRTIDKELKQVDKALKFNPTSVELWRQKQQLLTQKIDETKNKLEVLKQAQAKMDADGVDKNSEEYRKLQREIIVAENQVKTFESQLRQVGNVSLRAASEQVKEIGNNLESAGQKMQGISLAAGAVVTALGALSYSAGTTADELNTLSKVYGIGTDELQMYAAAADLVDVDVDTIAKSHVKLGKSMASAATGTGDAAEAFDKLGISVVDSNGDLRDSDAVWQETIAALGEVDNETERNALAMQLMGKSAAELNPLIEDGGETYKNLADTMSQYGLEFVDQETLDKANQFNDELDTMKAIGAVALAQVGSQLAATLAPALEKVVDLVGRFANWLSTLSPEVLTVIGVVAAVLAVVAPVLMILGKLAFAISSIISLIGVVGPAIGGVIATLGPIVAVIAAVIAVGVLLYKNWDLIKAKAIQFKDSIINAFNLFKQSIITTFNNIKAAIVTPFQTAFDKVKAIIDKIKGWFPIKVGNLLSGIKLPHFKITGEFSIKNKTVPHLSIDWYKTGGIFSSPSVIGVGEAGAEAVVPLDKFWDKLDQMQGGTTINININGASGDPRAIAEEVRRVLIQETNRRRLAWQ